MATSRRNQLILAGIILAALVLMSTQLPSLTPWFVGWLLAGTAMSFAYKRRRPGLIAASAAAVLVLAGLGLYPRFQAMVANVEANAPNVHAKALTDKLIEYGKTTGQPIPGEGDPAWSELTAGMAEGVDVQVKTLPHRAALLSAAESLQADAAQAGDLTVFVAESQFFVIVPRDAQGVPAGFAEDLSNLKQGHHAQGEARAVDTTIPANQPMGSDGMY